jgi:D-alanyl-lipoteichoic acid acyltransferase DltB (MBOAT superfamily)
MQHSESTTPTLADAWLGAVAYTIQLFFDFSGYTDMAIGLALMIGFVFPENFNDPYVSRSITEFWKRWHMSLSNWLREYLYIALGGNRKGVFRTYVNLFLTMLLGGLWHGANWTFVLWGSLSRCNSRYRKILGTAVRQIASAGMGPGHQNHAAGDCRMGGIPRSRYFRRDEHVLRHAWTQRRGLQPRRAVASNA